MLNMLGMLGMQTKAGPLETRIRVQWAAMWIARVAVALVFIYAAVPKILDPLAFAENIRNYQVFPTGTEHLIAGIVPSLELLAALCLLTGVKRRAGAHILSGMTVIFLALIASVIARGIDLDCGCFGQVEHAETAARVGWPTLVRDILLLGAALVAGLRDPRPKPKTEPKD